MHPDHGKQQTAPPPSTHDALPAEALAALQQGQVIEAIKQVRMVRGVGLKEAKAQVDAYLAGEPALQRKLAAAQAESRRGLIVWLAAIAMGIGAYWIFFSG